MVSDICNKYPTVYPVSNNVRPGYTVLEINGHLI